ncbi:MAG: serine/threonine protein kinase [Myxococcales bacterium]|nr:serine/threonine protein kinase [Myxococcales bacterium]
MASPPNKSQVPVGTVLEGKFRITKEIGRGGMATVYEAENITLGKRVAVKILSAELVTSRIVRERFIREARAAAAIRSPNICDVYDSGMFDSRPFLVMELLEGESLYDMMTRVRRIDADTTLAVMTQAARGLQKAHDSSVIHRDLKPENIFIIKTPEGEMVVKILDFGLAKFYEQTGEAASPRLTREGALFGTPAYMSPEQAKGQGEVDLRADLWALGCIVYECLTGTTVWNVDQGVAMILAQIAGAPIPKPSKLLPDLPARFDSWFTKALERDPEKRFQTAKEFAETLAEALQPATSVSPPAWRQSSAPSAEEGALVDLLVNQSQSGIPPARPAPSPADAVLTNTPSPAKKSGMGAIWALLAVASLALGGYAAWFYGLFPRPPVARPATSLPTASASVAPAPSASVPTYDRPLETDAYAKSVAQAQELMQNGQGDASLAAFKEAFNNGGSGVSRGLLSQAAVAIPNSDGKCKAMALGRPRPFDRTTPSSRPDIAVTTVGPIVTWVDNQQDATRRQAFTTVLDTALRRVAPARLVTPEASSARHTQLLVAGNRLALLFWDDGGADPGVHARLLEPDGRMAGPSRRISEAKRAEFYPSFDRGADGSYWVVWEQAVDDGVDLVARHLSHEVEPLGPITRLTALGSGRDGHGALASRPSLAIAESGLVISFMLERDKKRRVMILDVPFTDSALATGVKIDGKKKTEDRHLGKLIAVSPTRGTRGEARIVCDKAECFVAWDDDKAGAFAGFFNLEKSQTIWHREFARGGSAPSIAKSPTGAMVAYFEGNRVKLASMTRDGVEPAGVIAKVGGTQPYPAIAAGAKAGQWYVSWRDYESGHLEPYVVRAECQ